MNFVIISDILWYCGHVLTGSAVLFTHTNYGMAVSMVFVGQFITIISRPIGRIKPIKNKILSNLEEDTNN
jgi:hypothetical protein